MTQTNNQTRRTILLGSRQLREVTADAVEAIVAANEPVPTVFRYGSSMVRLRKVGDDAVIETMNNDLLTNHLGEVATWKRKGADGEYKPAYPDRTVISNVLAERDWPIPPIERVVTAPTFGPDGTLIATSGYHPTASLYLELDRQLVIPPVSSDPTAAEADQAKNIINGMLLGDFPFVSDADRAHAVAAMLLPSVRAIISGPTPLHLVNAPTKGTGKTLLAQAISYPMAGRTGVSTEAKNEEEWRKRVGAWLSSVPTVVSIDNLKNRLDSAALAAVLTEDIWVDRLLGRNDATIRYPNRALWLATGNGVTLSDELARRTIPINLDAGVEHPYLRPGSSFLFPNLRGFMRVQRGLLIWAALTLVQRWVRKGQPPGTTTIGSYESWAEVMGGILGVAGINGFLGNLDEFYASSDPETLAWNAFVTAWWAAHSDGVVRPSDLLTAYDLLDDDFLVLGGAESRVRASSLGRKLLGQRDRIFAGYKLVKVDTNQGGNRWRLQRPPS